MAFKWKFFYDSLRASHSYYPTKQSSIKFSFENFYLVTKCINSDKNSFKFVSNSSTRFIIFKFFILILRTSFQLEKFIEEQVKMDLLNLIKSSSIFLQKTSKYKFLLKNNLTKIEMKY